MPLFSIIAFDAPNSKPKRVEHLDAHVKALVSLKNDGRLFAAGPLRESIENNANDVGSLLIIDFKNQTEAEQWFHNEPFCKAGVYKDIPIRP